MELDMLEANARPPMNPLTYPMRFVGELTTANPPGESIPSDKPLYGVKSCDWTTKDAVPVVEGTPRWHVLAWRLDEASDSHELDASEGQQVIVYCDWIQIGGVWTRQWFFRYVEPGVTASWLPCSWAYSEDGDAPPAAHGYDGIYVKEENTTITGQRRGYYAFETDDNDDSVAQNFGVNRELLIVITGAANVSDHTDGGNIPSPTPAGSLSMNINISWITTQFSATAYGSTPKEIAWGSKPSDSTFGDIFTVTSEARAAARAAANCPGDKGSGILAFNLDPPSNVHGIGLFLSILGDEDFIIGHMEAVGGDTDLELPIVYFSNQAFIPNTYQL